MIITILYVFMLIFILPFCCLTSLGAWDKFLDLSVPLCVLICKIML